MDLNGTIHNATGQETDKPFLAVMGMLAFFSVLGTVGNSMVVYVYARKRHKVASTVFIIALATTDFMTCLVIVPYTITVEYYDYLIEYDILCKLYMFFITSNVPFAAFIMVAIAVDRYICICHPFLHILNAKRAKSVSFVLVVMAVTLGILTSLNYSVYNVSKVNSCHSDISSLIQNVSVSLLPSSSQRKTIKSLLKKEPFYKPSDDVAEIKQDCLSTDISYTGRCQPSETIFSSDFVKVYQVIYASLFLLALMSVFILYALVYRSVWKRRAKRRKQRRPTISTSIRRDSYCSDRRQSFQGIFLKKKPRSRGSQEIELARQMTIKEKGFVANIRTAVMLFVVTTVFTIVFLPAWLMAHNVIHYNIVVFYTYFFYNVANPIIYAFMNHAFRRDLKEVFGCNISNKTLN